jgi:hypothetical protein
MLMFQTVEDLTVRSQAYIQHQLALEREEQEMHIPLRYEGPLKSATDKKTQLRNKNHIRWYLSDQLINLQLEGDFSRFPAARPISKRFRGLGFFPIITRAQQLVCSLSVVIHRREKIGNILAYHGDLDNRMKTLFDALRMPQTDGEVLSDDSKHSKHAGRVNCACLLEDDSIISELHIKTMHSLEALAPNDVILTMDVEIKRHDLTYSDEDN